MSAAGEVVAAAGRAARRRQICELSQDAAVLRLVPRAEATRNPAIAAAVDAVEARAWLTETFGALATSPACDPAALFEVVNPVMKGMVIDRTLRRDHDPALAATHLRALIEAGLDGRLTPAWMHST